MANTFVFDESIQPTFFRVNGYYDGMSVNLHTIKFFGFCRTDKGWWVTAERGYYLQEEFKSVPQKDLLKAIKKRYPEATFWINDDGSTKKAWATLELALKSFKRRKIVQQSIIDAQQTSTQAQYAAACLLSPEEIDRLRLTGRVSHHDKVEWQPFLDQKKKEREALFGFDSRPF